MNKNDEDIDLRLALGSRNYSSSGAGVNANSKLDMPFAASDPLSELVWSPHNGLSLRCANPNSADNNPFRSWNVGESTKEILTSPDDKVSAGEEKLSASQTMIDGGGNIVEKATSSSDAGVHRKLSHGGSDGSVEKVSTADAIKEAKNKSNAEENIADIADDSKRNAELDIRGDATCDRESDTTINWKSPSKLIKGSSFDQKGRLDANGSRSGVIGLAVPTHSEPPTTKPSVIQHQIDDEVTSSSADAGKARTDDALALMKMESSAENDLGNLVAKEANSLEEMELLIEDTNQEKGKGKALSEGEIYGRLSNEKDNSHESVESCNSAGLFPKGVKRPQNYDEAETVGSKRMKKCVQGSLSPTSIVKADSSFMNWISNMVKGVPDSNKEESSLLALTLAHPNNQQEHAICKKTTDFAKPTGFQNVFQSLYCQTNKTYISESSELMVSHKKSLDRNNDSSSKPIILSDQEVAPQNLIRPWIFSADSATQRSPEKKLLENKASDIPECSRAILEGSSSEKTNIEMPLPVSCIPEKGSPLSSLWVTRLYTKNAKVENCNRITEEAIDKTNDVSEAKDENAGEKVHASEGDVQSFSPKDSFDFKYGHKQSPIQPSQELRSSEAMASLFAKRLDALKHIIHPSERRKPPTLPLTCFFCGNSGHDLRKCPELSETELENILVNISSFDRVDESPCLCIRCFRVNHWAISCPSQEQRQSKQNADGKCLSYIGRKEDDHKQVFPGQKKPIFGSFPSFLAWEMKESSSRRFSASNELQKSTLSNLENHMKEKQMFPPYKISDTQIAVPQEMFHAIRKLRLSRVDILRWMDTDVSLSHLNGFLLRLRLGKMEEGLGGTGYYVACITGDSIENTGYKSKKSVLVDVGGIKSSVGSQYISNHDFLEDEVKGWWDRIEKNGGKIPSLDELKSKFEDKKCLGL